MTTAGLSVCTFFLACISKNGVDPAFVHHLKITQPQQAEIVYDGNVNEDVLQAVKHCVPPLEKELVCRFHSKDQP